MCVCVCVCVRVCVCVCVCVNTIHVSSQQEEIAAWDGRLRLGELGRKKSPAKKNLIISNLIISQQHERLKLEGGPLTGL